MAAGRAFSAYADDQRSPRPWGLAVAGSAGVYLVLALVVVGFAVLRGTAAPETEVQLTFIENVPKPEPPPPPTIAPAPAPAEAAPAPAAAPIVPPQLKVQRLSKPPPPKELVAPREMPKEAPKEAEPSMDPGVAVFGEPGLGDAAGLEGGSAPGIAGGQVGVIELPDGASAPVPLASNVQPRYPREARRSGKTGVVVLKAVILADGSVSDVQVESGDEPFVAAALTAVKKWRYQPARNHGIPIAVYRLLRITFELDA